MKINNIVVADTEKEKPGYVEDSEYDNMAARLAAKLLKSLKSGLEAKSVPARFRSTQLIANILRVLPSVETDLYPELRESVLDRINDKEAAIRVQAVLAYAALCSDELDIDPDVDDMAVTEILSDVLAHDNSAYVGHSMDVWTYELTLC